MNVDYYLSLNSPWTYMGHARLMQMAERASARVTPFPVDFRDTIFPSTGGLPVPQRPPARQKYRLQELQRWRRYLNLPLKISPAFWPANEIPAETVVIALRESGEVDAALRLAGLLMQAVWERDLDIGDIPTITSLVDEAQIDKGIVEHANSYQWQNLRLSDSKAAIEKGVFGAPSYIIDDQIYWGQDRLEFVQRALADA